MPHLQTQKPCPEAGLSLLPDQVQQTPMHEVFLGLLSLHIRPRRAAALHLHLCSGCTACMHAHQGLTQGGSHALALTMLRTRPLAAMAYSSKQLSRLNVSPGSPRRPALPLSWASALRFGCAAALITRSPRLHAPVPQPQSASGEPVVPGSAHGMSQHLLAWHLPHPATIGCAEKACMQCCR